MTACAYYFLAQRNLSVACANRDGFGRPRCPFRAAGPNCSIVRTARAWLRLAEFAASGIGR